jgi:hypothetical protein
MTVDVAERKFSFGFAPNCVGEFGSGVKKSGATRTCTVFWLKCLGQVSVRMAGRTPSVWSLSSENFPLCFLLT